MSSREFAEWMAYEELDPGEPIRSDIRDAHLCQLLANIHRDKKRHGAYKIKDFLLFEGSKKDDRPRTASELKAKMMNWLGGFKKAKSEEVAMVEKRKKKREGTK